VTSLTARIKHLDSLAPEQIASSTSDETDAVFADQWSRLHPLRAHTVIGRDTTCTIAVLQTSVSRRHAELRYDLESDSWTISDLGSRNGTFIEGKRLTAMTPHPLGDRQIVNIGDVAFVCVLDRGTLPVVHATESFRATVESSGPAAAGSEQLRVSAPTTEGAGMVGYRDETIPLGPTQFALLRLLAERYLASAADDPELRGFVRSIELIANLPWNTPHPEDNHVKQQIRRLRRSLERLGLPEAIESRHGFGYRLVIAPILGGS
jgi:pSer/pThr/pTyr-binding forkhead associated (FHA) protein